ncbi:MAG: helix-turn-helix transcriptional regulator [Pseudomonadota bacterium]
MSVRQRQKVAELFGKRLRELTHARGSASQVARDLLINRQQFARYLSGDVLPRAGIFDQIADYFDIAPSDLVTDCDKPDQSNSLNDSIGQFLSGLLDTNISEDELPSGIYLHYRNSFYFEDRCIVKIVRVFRKDDQVFIRRRNSTKLAKDYPMMDTKQDSLGIVLRSPSGFIVLDSNTFKKNLTIYSLRLRGGIDSRFFVGIHLEPGIGGVPSPRATKVCWRRINDQESLLQAARSQGTYAPGELPANVRYYLSSQPGVMDGVIVAGE